MKRGKQLSVSEWLEVFKHYKEYLSQNITKKEFCYIYSKIRNSENYLLSEEAFWYLSRKYKDYNLGMELKESQTGKAPKKGKGSGRPRKNKEEYDKQRNEVIKEIDREVLEWLITDLFKEDILKKNKVDNLDELIEKIKKKFGENISNKEIMKILGIPKSTFYYKIKKQSKDKKEAVIEHAEIIREAFAKQNGRYGRERLSAYIFKTYGIIINPRTLGRAMNKLGLFCHVRTTCKKKRESKNTNVYYPNIANRDYNGLQNDIYASDVSYIPAPIDVEGRHVYLSIVIHHKTKKIVSYNLSIYNDTNLIMTHIRKTKFPKNFIIHTDHGVTYSSNEYLEYIKQRGGVVSMSRIGNSLDNREAEYFFSILKSEMFYNFEKKVKEMTFSELKECIKNFIEWYNNERILKKFKWKTPQELWGVYNKHNYLV
ncbi:IS3 family transposase [Mycoplasma yeatsii]|nr:IS3 family transposase [Mycoplasma yeatsii]AJM71665.1 transposase for ISMye2 [Mycoplasma yeatsii GM274B]AJM71728.1 transposase for ISMye2 [Mycoplasma yeatsii GM274B]AJM71839.1 transposase for ISMye2 [Mycoplasma yeatsii GM274B]AJM71963.1 transposase for ISMye2 [Mycoplasma yeatsii GM274B]AJM72060.1 transposase for ISMye2 [Mycoplasma yeatsii GM274B]